MAHASSSTPKRSAYLSEVARSIRVENGFKKVPRHQLRLNEILESRDKTLFASVDESFKILEAISRPPQSRHPRSFSRPKPDSPLSQNFTPIRKYICGINDPSSSRTNDDARTKSIFTTCGQASPIPLGTVINSLKKLRKVGEGVFGEVYVGQFGTAPTSRIFKIVAIEGRKLVNDQVQRKFEQIESEIRVSQYLNKLHYGYNGCYTEGYVFLHNARICQGKYPQKLMRAWNAYKKAHPCENTKPDYGRNQLYAVFEYDFSGVDICNFHFRTFKQSLIIVLQVAHALAVAEAACEFEHRDLHWGNVLIQETRNNYNVYTIGDKTFRVPCAGLATTIIDFTISRITTESGECVYFDLANDEEQFSGPDPLQFGVYKKMRRMTKNTWWKYAPKSNVLWIHYLISKFVLHIAYTDAGSDEHYDYGEDLRRLRNGVLKYNSCTECVQKFLAPFVRRLEDESQ